MRSFDKVVKYIGRGERGQDGISEIHLTRPLLCFFKKGERRPERTEIPKISPVVIMSSSDQMGFDFGERCPADSSEQSAVRCAHCRLEIEVPAWYAGQAQLHFCDASCRRAWTEAMPSLEVCLGEASKRRGANWELQALKARTRDSFTCQVCGVSEEELGRQLDVHHKIPYRSFSSNVEANKLEHLISVCPSCHSKLEAELRHELPLFIRS